MKKREKKHSREAEFLEKLSSYSAGRLGEGAAAQTEGYAHEQAPASENDSVHNAERTETFQNNHGDNNYIPGQDISENDIKNDNYFNAGNHGADFHSTSNEPDTNGEAADAADNEKTGVLAHIKSLVRSRTSLAETDDTEDIYEEDTYGETEDGGFFSRLLSGVPRSKVAYALICFLIICAAAFGYAVALNCNESYITVSILFSEITSGNNPDGSPFDIYEIMSDDVLDRACEKLENKIDPDTLKKHLWVTGVSTTTSFDMVKQNIRDGNENFSYYPNSFLLSYSVVSDSVRADGMLASVGAVFKQVLLPSKEKILRAVAESYREYYDDTYVITSRILEMQPETSDDIDYFNKAAALENILIRLEKYLNERYSQDPNFISPSGMSFGDLSGEFTRLRENDLDNFKSFIVRNGITINKEKLINQFEYSLENYKLTVRRKNAEYNVMLEGVDIYDPNVTKVVFIPALDEDRQFYMNRTKMGIDYLTELAETAQRDANDAQAYVRDYEYYIDQFSKAGTVSDELMTEADKRFGALVEKVSVLLEQAVVAHDDFIRYSAHERIEIGSSGKGIGFMSSLISAGKIIVILTALSYVLYCLYRLFVVRRKWIDFIYKLLGLDPQNGKTAEEAEEYVYDGE